MDRLHVLVRFSLSIDYSGVFRATCPEFESHHPGTIEPPASSLFQGALDMSLCRT